MLYAYVALRTACVRMKTGDVKVEGNFVVRELSNAA